MKDGPLPSLEKLDEPAVIGGAGTGVVSAFAVMGRQALNNAKTAI